MRSTQFDEHSSVEEKPEDHPRKNQPDTLCEKIKRLGYAQNNQVRLYGEVFDLVSDPVSVGENFVFVDGLERKSGHLRRVRIPSTIVEMARKKIVRRKRTLGRFFLGAGGSIFPVLSNVSSHRRWLDDVPVVELSAMVTEQP